MKVISYLRTVPPGNKNPEKENILTYFVQGVNHVGDQGILQEQTTLLDCDVAVIQGWVHEGSRSSIHLNFRKSIIDKQHADRKHVLIADSNLFLYADKTNPHHYLRYSFNGVFPTTGNYFNSIVDPDRWQQISKDHGINLKPWRTQGNHILICTQRNGGWSMKGFDVVEWLEKTVTEIRKYTARPIIVRAHPGDKNAINYLNAKDTRWTISNSEKITDDFINAWAVITYNSSPAVAAAIEGIPVFVTDPIPQMSQAFEVANTELSLIESPKLFERQQWIEKTSMSHWSFQQLKSGQAWNHIKKYIYD
jgi:hypothetical protein